MEQKKKKQPQDWPLRRKTSAVGVNTRYKNILEDILRARGEGGSERIRLRTYEPEEFGKRKDTFKQKRPGKKGEQNSSRKKAEGGKNF